MLNVFTCFLLALGYMLMILLLSQMTYHTKRVVQEFAMTDNDKIKYCLGIQIKCDQASKIFFFSQEKYIYHILHKFHMEIYKPTLPFFFK